jgi:hypothetical protein
MKVTSNKKVTKNEKKFLKKQLVTTLKQLGITLGFFWSNSLEPVIMLKSYV